MRPERQALIQNPPMDVQEKLESLDRHRQTIDALKSRLLEEVLECERLEKELAPYYSSIAPIQDCPTEVLSVMFKAYIDDDLLSIRDLMLVCRHWYHTAVGDAKLWTTIPVFCDMEAPMSEVVRWNKLYIEACQRNNKSLPFDLTLDFGGLGYSPKEGVYPLMWKDCISASSSLDESSSDDISDFDTEDYGGKGDDLTRLEPSNLVTAIFGSSFNIITHCKSIKIIFPDAYQLSSAIWTSLTLDVPALKRLSMYNTRFAYSTPLDPIGFKQLESLQELEIDEICGFILTRQVEKAPIKKLTVYTTLGTSETLGLDRFTRLVVLAITSTRETRGVPTHNPTRTLILPVLRELSLFGHFTAIEFVDFDLPQLQVLHLQHESARGGGSLSLPNICVPTVSWTNIDLDRHCWSKLAARGHLTKVLERFLCSETLRMPACGKDVLVKVLEGFRSTGSIPGSWREVSLCNDWDESIEMLKIEDIS